MTAPGWLRFQARLFPSANFAAAAGAEGALLFDSGFGSDLDETFELLAGEELDRRGFAIANTHWHSDHVGGNAALAARFGIPVLASAAEGSLVNAGDPDRYGADFLDQPVDDYRVDRLLEPGEEFDGAGLRWRVVDLSGHSLGQVGFFEPGSRVLLAGDALLARDVAWLNPFLDGPDVVARAAAAMERIRDLEPTLVVPGHGPLIDDVPGALDRTFERLRRWAADPAELAWHGPPRVFAYALMIRRGIPRESLRQYMLGRRWLRDFAGLVGLTPAAYADRMLERLLDGGGVRWSEDGGRLLAGTPHRAPPPDWSPAGGFPSGLPA